MSDGWENALGTVNSVIVPSGVMRAILLTSKSDSVNHMLPSEPSVICRGRLLSVGTRKDLKCPRFTANCGLTVTDSVGDSARSHAAAASATTLNAAANLLCLLKDILAS